MKVGRGMYFFKRKKGACFSLEQLAVAVGTKGGSSRFGKKEDVGEHMYTWVLSGAASSLAESALGLAELCAPWDQLEVILHAFL